MIEKYTDFRKNRVGGVNALINGIETTLTDAEISEINNLGVEIAPYVEPVKTLADVRADRDLLLTQNVDIYNPLRWAELTAAQKDSVKKYRQALLDITKQDPTSVIWPTLTI